MDGKKVVAKKTVGNTTHTKRTSLLRDVSTRKRKGNTKRDSLSYPFF